MYFNEQQANKRLVLKEDLHANDISALNSTLGCQNQNIAVDATLWKQL